jgi:cob(I)alamin adenosyltransferase
MDTTSSRPWSTGYVHVYTGDGKGKTTAALGLALRGIGAGLRVFFAQFVKGMTYSEHRALEQFADQLVVRQYGRGCFIVGQPEKEDLDAAARGINEVRQVLASGEYDVVVLDEANIATYLSLVPVQSLLDLMELRPEHVELVITGRRADAQVIQRADLVTEMREIKHYYTTGVEARQGIEM